MSIIYLTQAYRTFIKASRAGPPLSQFVESSMLRGYGYLESQAPNSCHINLLQLTRPH